MDNKNENNKTVSLQANKTERTWYKAFRLLPEALRLRREQRKNLDFVLRQWRFNNEEEIPVISRQIRLGIVLVEWSWLIGIILIISGILSIDLAQKYSNRIQSNNISEGSGLESKNGSKTLGYAPTDNVIRIAALGTIQDRQSPDFNAGQLTVQLNGNVTPEDRLGIYHQGNRRGEIGVTGNAVKFSGEEIGRFEGGEGTVPLEITFNRNANRAKAQALVRQITYRNTASNPTPGDRVVKLKITDGDGGISDTLTRKIRILEEPIYQLSLPNSKDGKENTNISIDTFKIESPENNKVSIVLSASQGIITIKEDVTGGLDTESIDGNQTQKVTLTETVDKINSTFSAPQSLVYKSNRGFSGEDRLKVQLTEADENLQKRLIYPPKAQEFLSITQTVPIAVSLLNPPPQVVVPGSQLTNPDQDLLIGGIQVSDPNNQNVTVTLEVDSGRLTVKSDVAEGLTAKEIENNQTGKITLRSSISEINATLNDSTGIVYKSEKDFIGKDTLAVSVNDGEKSSNGEIEITVNDDPILEIPEAVTINGNILTKPDAVNIIASWLEAKENALSPPYSRSILERYTTGNYYEGRAGAMGWLRRNGGAYSFSKPTVEPAGEFSRQGEQVIIDIRVTQNSTLRVRGRIDPTESGLTQGMYRYTLRFDDQTWKISDSNELDS
jgi:hypothetical protein